MSPPPASSQEQKRHKRRLQEDSNDTLLPNVQKAWRSSLGTAVVIEVFRGFQQSIQANSGMLP
jgi:hypothetical protein